MNKIAFLIGLSVQEEIKQAVGTIQNGQLCMNFVRVREGPFEEVRYILRPERDAQDSPEVSSWQREQQVQRPWGRNGRACSGNRQEHCEAEWRGWVLGGHSKELLQQIVPRLVHKSPFISNWSWTLISILGWKPGPESMAAREREEENVFPFLADFRQ